MDPIDLKTKIDLKTIAAMIAIGTYAGTANSSSREHGSPATAASQAVTAAEVYITQNMKGGKKSKRRKLKRRKSKRRKSKRRRTKRR